MKHYQQLNQERYQIYGLLKAGFHQTELRMKLAFIRQVRTCRV